MAAPTTRTVVAPSEELKNGLQTLLEKLQDKITAIAGQKDEIDEQTRTFCDKISEITNSLSGLDKLAASKDMLQEPQQIPEFSYPMETPVNGEIKPFIHYEQIKVDDFFDLSENDAEIHVLIPILAELISAIGIFMSHMNLVQNDLAPAHRMISSIYGYNFNAKNHLLTQMVKYDFCVEDYAYAAMVALSVVQKYPAKEFKERSESYITEIKKSGGASQDYLTFWSKLTPASASQMINKHFLIITPFSVNQLASILFKELSIIYRFRSYLNSADFETAIDTNFINYNLFPKLAELVQSFSFDYPENTKSPDDTKNDILGLQQILLANGEEDFVTSEECLEAAYGGCLCAGNKRTSDVLGATDSQRSKKLKFEPSSGSEDFLFLGMGPKDKKEFPPLVPNSVARRVEKDVTFLDNLIHPFGEIMRMYGGYNLNRPFGFLNNFDETHAFLSATSNICEFYDQVPHFGSMWGLLPSLFEKSSLDAMNLILENMFPELAKSLYISYLCLQLNSNYNANISNVYDKDSEDTASLLKCLQKNKDTFFPFVFGFREAAFLTSYLARRENRTNVYKSDVSLTCVLDGFLLSPQSLITLLHAIGHFMKFLDQSRNAPNYYAVLLKLFTNEDTGLNSTVQVQNIVVLCCNKILDFIYQLVHVNIIPKKSSISTSEKVLGELQKFGVANVTSIEVFREVLPNLETAVNTYEKSLNITLTSTSQVYLKSSSMLNNISRLVLGMATPTEFFHRCSKPIFDTARIIAYSVYFANKDKIPKTDNDADEENFVDIDVACGPSEEYSSLCNMLCDLIGKKNNITVYRVGSNCPDLYALPLANDSVYPLSFYPLFKNSQRKPNTFSSSSHAPTSVCGDSNCNYIGKNRYILSLDNHIPDNIKDMCECVPVGEYNDARDLFYYIPNTKQSMPSACGRKCVRSGNDLLVTTNKVSVDWLEQLKSVLHRNTPSQYRIVVVKNPKIQNLDDYHVIPPFRSSVDTAENTYLLNCIRRVARPTPTEDPDWLDSLLDYSMMDDVLLVSNKCNAPTINTGWGKGGVVDLDDLFQFKIPDDITNTIVERRERSSRVLEDIYSELDSKLSNVCSTYGFDSAKISLSTAIESLARNMKSDKILQLPILDIDASKKSLSQLLYTLPFDLEQFKGMLDGLNYKAASMNSSSDSRKNIKILMTLMVKLQNIIPDFVEKHFTHLNHLTNVLNDMEASIYFAIFSLWSLIHFYSYPHMYVLDQVQRASYTYLDQFVEFSHGGFYVNLVKFIEYVDTNHKAIVNSVDYLARFVYALRITMVVDKPYIFLFQNCNLLKTPMIPCYIGLVCIFIAHTLEKDPTLVV